MSDQDNGADVKQAGSVKSEESSNSGKQTFDPAKWVDKATFNKANEKAKTLAEALDAQSMRSTEESAARATLEKALAAAEATNKTLHTQYKLRESLVQEGVHDPDVIAKVVNWDTVQDDKIKETVAALKEKYSWAFKQMQANEKPRINPAGPAPANGADPYGFAGMTEGQRIKNAMYLQGEEKSKYLAASKAYLTRTNN